MRVTFTYICIYISTKTFPPTSHKFYMYTQQYTPRNLSSLNTQHRFNYTKMNYTLTILEFPNPRLKSIFTKNISKNRNIPSTHNFNCIFPKLNYMIITIQSLSPNIKVSLPIQLNICYQSHWHDYYSQTVSYSPIHHLSIQQANIHDNISAQTPY